MKTNRRLYESIMRDVAKVVKRHLNEHIQSLDEEVVERFEIEMDKMGLGYSAHRLPNDGMTYELDDRISLGKFKGFKLYLEEISLQKNNRGEYVVVFECDGKVFIYNATEGSFSAEGRDYVEPAEIEKLLCGFKRLVSVVK